MRRKQSQMKSSMMGIAPGYFWVTVTLMQSDGRRIHAGRQGKPRVQADIRIFRFEVFLHKQFQNELRNSTPSRETEST